MQSSQVPNPPGSTISKMKIATHNGKFHADEVFAISLLRRLERFADAEIIRTRDTELLKTADVVVDVGGQYDPSTHRYDHHQVRASEEISFLIPL